MKSFVRAATVGVAFAVVGHAAATDYRLEYDRKVKSSHNIGALGDDLAGDSVDQYTGALKLRATDISLPTNGFTLSLARRYTADYDESVATVHTGNTGPYTEQELHLTRMHAFGDWDLDVPHIRTVMGKDSGWVVDSPTPLSRCKVVGQLDAQGQPISGAPPKLYGTLSTPFWADTYFNGYTLHVGDSDQTLLVASLPNNQRPSANGPYHWTTTKDWWVSCLDTAANVAGQAFLAHAPDGTKYTFNWLSKRIVNSSTETDVRGYQFPVPRFLFRSEYTMLPTRIEDRFGNWVTYKWTNDDFARLERMDAGHAGSTDFVQRILVEEYTPEGYIKSVRVEVSGELPRYWRYSYTDARLTQVTLPDGKFWGYNLGLTGATDEYEPICLADEQLDPEERKWVCWGGGDVPDIERGGSVTHPSGAQVQFVIGPNFRLSPGHQPSYPLGLRRKTISGPGIQTATWRYDYLPSVLQAKDACRYATCPALISTDQVNPDGSIIRRLFSHQDTTYQGELAGALTANGGGSPPIATSTRFASALTAPNPGTGTVPTWYTERDTRYANGASAGFTARVGLHPLYQWLPGLVGYSEQRVAVSQQLETLQGVVFSTQHTAFDVYARPTATMEGSVGGSAGPFTRYLTRSYHDDTNKWVIGQLRTTGCTTTSDCTPAREISRTDYDAATALPWKTYRFGQLQNEFTYTGGLLTGVKDGRGYSIGLGSWAYGVPRAITFPTAATMSAEMHPLGWVKSATDELGSTTNFSYDDVGRLTRIAYPANDTVAWTALQRAVSIVDAVEYGIPAKHWRQEVWTGTGKTTTYLDARLQPVLVLTEDTANAASKSFVVSRFDAMGRVVFRSYPVGSLSTVGDPALLGVRTSYDGLGRVTRVQQDSESIGGSTLRNTDTAYLSGFRTQVTNPRGFPTTTSYQLFGQPSTDSPVLIELPEGVTTSILRQPGLGKPRTVTRAGTWAGSPLSATRSYVYDSLERLCQTLEPESGATIVDYDGNDNIAWSADGQVASGTTAASCAADRLAVTAANKISRSYDPMNREQTRTTAAGTSNVTATYFPDGQVQSLAATNPGGNVVTTTYTYNKRRFLTREVLQVNTLTPWTSDYAFDANGHLSTQTYPGNLLIGYAPDGLGRPTQAGTFATGVTYYPNGAMSGFTYGNGVVHSMTQNERQLPIRSLDSYISGGVTTKVLDDTYAYDANGNVLKLVDASSSPTADNRTWGVAMPTLYDGLDRLRAVRSSYQWGAVDWNGYNANYTYDPLDNLRSNQLGASILTYTYDSTNRLTQLTNGVGSQWAVTSDTRGNITANALRNQGYEFDLAHRMNAVTGKESYLYDGHGRRARTLNLQTGSIEYFGYSKDGRLMQDWSNRRGVRNGYIYLGNTLVGLYEVNITNGAITPKYQHTDALGSPVVTTKKGALASDPPVVLSRMGYTPYGAPTMPMDGVGYTGHFVDVGTQLTYMQQRYYDPQVGRFLSIDPVTADDNAGGNFNRYWYANNNPYKYIDPDGRLPLLIPVVIFVAKELASEAVEQTTGIPMPTVKNLGKVAIKQGAKQLAKRAEPSQLSRGKRAHREEPVLTGEKAEVPTPSGKRMDRYDEEKAHIREIKPDNPRQIRSGERQVEGYRQEMEKKTGRPHTTEVSPYDPAKYE